MHPQYYNNITPLERLFEICFDLKGKFSLYYKVISTYKWILNTILT